MTFGEGQMVFWEGPNCSKKSILSMERHRHNASSPSFGGGQIIFFRAFGRGHGPVAPLESAHGAVCQAERIDFDTRVIGRSVNLTFE